MSDHRFPPPPPGSPAFEAQQDKSRFEPIGLFWGDGCPGYRKNGSLSDMVIDGFGISVMLAGDTTLEITTAAIIDVVTDALGKDATSPRDVIYTVTLLEGRKLIVSVEPANGPTVRFHPVYQLICSALKERFKTQVSIEDHIHGKTTFWVAKDKVPKFDTKKVHAALRRRRERMGY